MKNPWIKKIEAKKVECITMRWRDNFGNYWKFNRINLTNINLKFRVETEGAFSSPFFLKISERCDMQTMLEVLNKQLDLWHDFHFIVDGSYIKAVKGKK